ncbi:IclR family transcriptional regulator [Telmatospirillum siberiense]|uniref:IclR family transcriptional regulator n=1 Tax=Telmatospirillum siberiense TaxID=382514 RepID=A0A2N3Q0A8_9PROT|nr:IclR family transcriptional regulator [Telmatospirillum siberiense]PKU26097.1 IclR family transcriptional regulator [Telmatospirillum siberiense]
MTRSRGVVQMPKDSEPSGVDVLDRAFAILFAFRSDDAGLSLAELSERTGLYKSTLLRLAGALIHHKFLSRLDDGRYRLGPASFVLGCHYQAGLRLGDVLLPLMRELNREFGEAVSFHIREGDRRICLHRIDSTFSIRAQVREGDVQGLELGAGGRVLLAFSGAEGEPYESVRRSHSYMSFGERDPETAGISVPVFGIGQRLQGALGIVGPTSRVDRPFMERVRGRLLAVAAEATEALGGNSASLRHAAAL